MLARDIRPDHVDNHASGVQKRAKPTTPKLVAYGSLLQMEPIARSEGSIVVSQQRRSASVRHIVIAVVCAPRMRSALLPPSLARFRAERRWAIRSCALASSRATRSR